MLINSQIIVRENVAIQFDDIKNSDFVNKKWAASAWIETEAAAVAVSDNNCIVIVKKMNEQLLRYIYISVQSYKSKHFTFFLCFCSTTYLFS